MKFKTYQDSKQWTPTQANTAEPEAVEQAKRSRSQLETLLSTLLLSENLIVLTGLGTSLCVKDTANNSVAPTMTDLWNSAKSRVKSFEPILMKVKQPREASGTWKEDIETLLSRCQMYVELNDDAEVRSFIEDTERLISKSCDFIGLLPAGTGLPTHEAFLRKLARRPTRLQRTKLFTTNYDLCFETAAAAVGFVMIDGFSHATPQDFDGNHFSYDIVRRGNEQDVPEYISNVIQFLKLHGSVDWEKTTDGRIRRSPAPSKPIIIYPRNGKFESSYSQPYFEMMSQFQTALRLPNTGLLVVGFGFNDSHLVGPLSSALRSNSSLRIVSVGPNYESKMAPFVKNLEDLIDAGDRRLTLVASGFEDLVSIIPDISAISDEEQHLHRMKKVP